MSKGSHYSSISSGAYRNLTPQAADNFREILQKGLKIAFKRGDLAAVESFIINSEELTEARVADTKRSKSEERRFNENIIKSAIYDLLGNDFDGEKTYQETLEFLRKTVNERHESLQKEECANPLISLSKAFNLMEISKENESDSPILTPNGRRSPEVALGRK